MQPTAWANTPRGGRPIRVRDGFLQGTCEAPVAFALVLNVGLAEFEDDLRKQEVGLTTELEYWAYVDDITLATTAELAPLVMDRLKEILERHGMELRSDKCTAYCPTPARTGGIREEMRQCVKWTPEGLMILGTASDGEYRTEITETGAKDHEPTQGRLQRARALADKVRQMCEADLDCRRLAPAWKLVNIVLNNALSFDCCVVPPEALASHAQELDEIVDALLPLFAGQDRLEHASIRRMRLPKQYLAIAPSVARTTGVPAMETLGLLEQQGMPKPD